MMRKRQAATGLPVVSAALLSALSSAALACDWSKLQQLHRSQDSQSIAASLIDCAHKGNPQAQSALARRYQFGHGINPDELESAWWHRKAAEQGVAEAQFQLGLMYLEGRGVTQNSHQALAWIAKAADRRHPEATAVLRYILSTDEVLDC